MKKGEILEEIRKLPTTERLVVIEAALHLVCEDFKKEKQLPNKAEIKQQLTGAAKALLADYAADGELTIFTALDTEEVHA